MTDWQRLENRLAELEECQRRELAKVSDRSVYPDADTGLGLEMGRLEMLLEVRRIMTTLANQH